MKLEARAEFCQQTLEQGRLPLAAMTAMRVDERNVRCWAGRRRAAAKIHRFTGMKSPTGVMQCLKFGRVIALLLSRPDIDLVMHRRIDALYIAAGKEYAAAFDVDRSGQGNVAMHQRPSLNNVAALRR